MRLRCGPDFGIEGLLKFYEQRHDGLKLRRRKGELGYSRQNVRKTVGFLLLPR